MDIIYCQNFKKGYNHYSRLVMKRCKSKANKTLNNRQLCENCFKIKSHPPLNQQ